jgi:tetratricopeptide (TPR) repeat protein
MPKPRKPTDPTRPINPAALRAMMERTLGGLGPNKRSNEQRAQELVYDAWEAPTAERGLRLVQQALELDAENVDALLMMADAAGFKGDERVEVLRGIVAAGAKRLGKKAFQELVPHFWGFHETRPYMRARERLAEELRAAGRLEEAIKEYDEMLALNENDNQGVRYHLLPSLLALGRLEAAQALMNRYKNECEWSVVFAWGRVLERVLSGDAAAGKALAVARKQNAHMEAYLKGHRKLPKNLPGSYSPGSKEEALCFAEPLLMAWTRHPDAQAWLSSQATSSKKSMDGLDRMDGMDTPSNN